MRNNMNLLVQLLVTEVEVAVNPSQIKTKSANNILNDVALCPLDGYKCSSYDDNNKTGAIRLAVRNLGQFMHNNHKDTSNAEKSIVQPYMRDTFLPAIRALFRSPEKFDLQNERSFRFQISVGLSREHWTVRGSTDHVFKLKDSDAVVFDWEDKGLQVNLCESSRAQLWLEMYNSLRVLNLYKSDGPPEYCGVLHNTRDWEFLMRSIDEEGEHWKRVVVEHLWTSEGVDESKCCDVAKLIEHCMVVAEVIADSLSVHKQLDLDSLSIGDRNNDDEHGNDDHTQDNNRPNNNNASQSKGRNSLSKSNTKNASQKSGIRGEKGNQGKPKNRNASQNDCNNMNIQSEGVFTLEHDSSASTAEPEGQNYDHLFASEYPYAMDDATIDSMLHENDFDICQIKDDGWNICVVETA